MPQESGHIKIFSPAKINLFLQVMGKRADGYHDLVSLMCCICLYDIIYLESVGKEIKVLCNHPDVPDGMKNIAWQATALFGKNLQKRHGIDFSGIQIQINKKIPVAAGLGGGSSNAAAVLLGLNKMYGYPFSVGELMKMGADIGADVPFLIYQKPAIATGIGDRLQSFKGLRPLKLLLVDPGFSVSTALIYKNLNLGLTNCAKKLKQFYFDQPDFDIEKYLCNDLEAVTISLFPEVYAVKETLLREGATGALMSGSGPSVFGFFSSLEDLQNAKQAISKNRPWRLIPTELII